MSEAKSLRGASHGVKVPGLRGLAPGRVARRTYDEFLQDDMWTYAAALAYHGLFALFPFLLFLLAVFSFLHLPELFGRLAAEVHRFLPDAAQARVLQVLGEVRGRRHGGLLSLGIAGALWVASGGMRSTMNALNRAYDVDEGRRWWTRYPLSVAYTLAFAVVVMLCTALMVLGPGAAEWGAARLGAGRALQAALGWLRVPIALVLALVTIAAVYLAAPNVRQRPAHVLPGAVLALALWTAMSFGFQAYVSSFGHYAVTYGSVGAVIVLLAYSYLSGAALLLGAELNAVLQHDAPRPGDATPQEPAPASKRKR